MTNLDSAAAISDSGVDSSLGTTTAISAASSAAMLSWERERECVAEPTGLGHLRTAWSSGSSSILVMEGEPPRLPDGDGVDDEDEERPPFEGDLRIKRIVTNARPLLCLWTAAFLSGNTLIWALLVQTD